MYCDPIYLQAMPSHDPDATALFREEWYEGAEHAPRKEAHPSMERGLAAWVRAHTVVQAGRFVALL